MIVLDDNKPLIILGDTHSQDAFLKAIAVITRAIKTGANVLHLGDTGITFDEASVNRQLHYLSLHWQDKRIMVYAIRGNHDRKKFFDQGLSAPALKLLPDYSELSYCGASILAVGGSISVDRVHRKEKGWVYDTEEPTTPWPFGPSKHFKMVVAHDIPETVFAYGSSQFAPFSAFVDEDISLSKDCKANRSTLSEVFEKASPDIWFSGHYHNSFFTKLNSCTFRILAPSELYTIHKQELK